ncbi:hypothetical protein [Mycobacterium sp. ACS1612]|uniref:hypothetical protein n=1 Tax=Mycobacterium sp. ACS1612 TaxID=1834117 RepID=UPI0012E9E46D|nr:hypothetical protein [Mycobacterium sp. ACS1612]
MAFETAPNNCAAIASTGSRGIGIVAAANPSNSSNNRRKTSPLALPDATMEM